MLELFTKRGYSIGSGSLSPDSKKFIVSIPKNASSYMASWAQKNNWPTINIDNSTEWDSIEEIIVILRDPVSRWVSGICQYINTYILSVQGPNGPIFDPQDANPKYDYYMPAEQFITEYTQLTERLFFDVISLFDDHVVPQNEFIKHLRPQTPRKYFYVDNNLNTKIANYLSLTVFDDQDLVTNSAETNRDILLLQKFFKQRLVDRPELAKRVAEHYADDYNLIAQVINND